MQTGDIFQVYQNGKYIGNFSVSWESTKSLGLEEVKGGRYILITKNKSYTESDKNISTKHLGVTYSLVKLTQTI